MRIVPIGKRSIYQVKAVISILLILVTTPPHSLAQQRDPVKATNPVFILSGRISLDSLTRYVQLHSVFRFSFNSRKIQGDRQIYFAKGRYPLPRLLQRIRQSTGLYYNLHKEHVILQDYPPRGWTDAPSVPGGPRSGGGKRVEQPETITKKAPSVVAKTVRIQSVLQPIPQRRPIFARPLFVRPPAARPAPQPPSRRIPDWHLQAGLFAAETLYGNLRVEAGLSFLHVLVSHGTDGTRHLWQIGLGSVIRKKENTAWQLFATWSPLHAQFPPDTVAAFGKAYSGKGWWVNAGLHYSGKISGHWIFKTGATLNLLKTAYYVDGQLSNAINVFPMTQDPDKRYVLLKSPYYMVNTFNRNNPTNYKGWIGLTAGIYYNFHF